MMPGMDGFELCRRVKHIADLPIIVLSAVDASEAKVSALELYAEDYVTKPFDPDELVARVQRVLRRAAVGSPQISLDGGEIEVDLTARQLTTPSGNQQLTPTEARLLQVLRLGHRPGRPHRRAARPRLDATPTEPIPRTCGSPIRRLRRKLEPDPDKPRYLITERGIGLPPRARAAPPPGEPRRCRAAGSGCASSSVCSWRCMPPILMLVGAAAAHRVRAARRWTRTWSPSSSSSAAVAWAAILAIVFERSLADDFRSLLLLAQRGDTGGDPELGLGVPADGQPA